LTSKHEVLPAKIVIEPAKAWMSLAKIAFGYVFKRWHPGFHA
jgi:hypothetical protein